MLYRAPVPADAPAVLAVSDARDIADLGEVDHTLEELRDEWRSSDLDLEHDAQVVEDPEGRIVAYAAVRRRARSSSSRRTRRAAGSARVCSTGRNRATGSMGVTCIANGWRAPTPPRGRS